MVSFGLPHTGTRRGNALPLQHDAYFTNRLWKSLGFLLQGLTYSRDLLAGCVMESVPSVGISVEEDLEELELDTMSKRHLGRT